MRRSVSLCLSSLRPVVLTLVVTAFVGCGDGEDSEPGTEVDVTITREGENRTPGDMVDDGDQAPPNDVVAPDTADPSGTPAPPRVSWQLYTNNRFRYSVEWPADVLEAEGEAANGDGQVFSSADGSFTMRVFGRNLVESKGLKDIYREQKNEFSGAEITYDRLGDEFYVLSGRRDGMIFYEKTFLHDGILKRLSLRYPQQRKEEFDPVVERISGTFGGV